MKYSLTIGHVDTCLSCYVLDHCNGDDEQLFGVIVDKSSRMHHVKSELLSEINANGDKFPEEITEEQIAGAIRELFTANPLSSFDSSLEGATEHGEDCYAWFRASWSLDD